MKEEAEKLAGGKKPECKIESQEDKEIRILDDRRKALRNKENTSNIEKVEYVEVRKTVTKKRRIRARRKGKNTS